MPKHLRVRVLAYSPPFLALPHTAPTTLREGRPPSRASRKCQNTPTPKSAGKKTSPPPPQLLPPHEALHPPLPRHRARWAPRLSLCAPAPRAPRPARPLARAAADARRAASEGAAFSQPVKQLHCYSVVWLLASRARGGRRGAGAARVAQGALHGGPARAGEREAEPAVAGRVVARALASRAEVPGQGARAQRGARPCSSARAPHCR